METGRFLGSEPTAKDKRPGYGWATPFRNHLGRRWPFRWGVPLVLVLVVMPSMTRPRCARVRDGSGSGEFRLVHRALLRDPSGDVVYMSVADEDGVDPIVVVQRPEAGALRARVSYRHRALFVKMRFVDLRRIGWQEYSVCVETPATPFSAAGFFVRSAPRIGPAST